MTDLIVEIRRHMRAVDETLEEIGKQLIEIRKRLTKLEEKNDR